MLVMPSLAMVGPQTSVLECARLVIFSRRGIQVIKCAVWNQKLTHARQGCGLDAPSVRVAVWVAPIQ